MNALRIKLIHLFVSLALMMPLTVSLYSPTVHADNVPSPNNPDIVPGQVLVKYKQAPQSSGFAATSVTPLIQTLSFPESTSLPEKLAELQKDSNVEYAEPVYKFRFTEASTGGGYVTESVYYDENHMSYMQNWGKTVTNLTYAASVTPANQLSQVIVAVLDTGIDLNHPDLLPSIMPGYDFIHNTTTPDDDNGHGTHVSGIIAAKAASESGYTGVAPGAKILPVKVLDQDGGGTTATIVAGLQYAISSHANIISMSLGSSSNSRAIHDAIKQAVLNNILVVAAAGNESNNWIYNEAGQLDKPSEDTIRKAHFADYPAAYNEVISVGAVEQLADTNLTVADFSNVMKVDIAAPGVNIYSTFKGHSYAVKHGTSQATPFVAGLAALIKANQPNISVDRLRAILENSSTNMPSIRLLYNEQTRTNSYILADSDFYGHGLLNGQKPFAKSNFRFIQDLNQAASSNTISFTVYNEDIYGNVQTGNNSNILLYVEEFNEETNSIYNPVQYEVPLVDGVGKVNFTASALTSDAYHYAMHFGDLVGGYVDSSKYDFVRMPGAPTPSLAAGSYTSAQTVSLSSSTSGADLYYLYDDGSPSPQFQNYSAPFPFNKTANLVAFSKKNHVFSDYTITSYTFNIPPRAGGGGGGGGGGASSTQSPPGLNADGKMEYALQPSHVDLLIELGKDSKELALDATTKEKLDLLSVELDADIISTAGKRDKTIVIHSNDVTIMLTPNAFTVKNTNNKINFQASFEPAASISNYKALSSVYDFTITENKERIAAFNSPVEVKFAYDKSRVQDPQRLGVYTLDESTGSWNPVGGKLNSDGTITASLQHFSKYAVLESVPSASAAPKPTFADIQGHWAQKEIEELAGKQIIDGIDSTSFQPDLTMKRAQFVTLITKALKLNSPGSSAQFEDVADNAWYKAAVLAAFDAKIVSGVSDRRFAPESNITREQMAVLMVNAYLYATGKKLSDFVFTQEVKYSDEGIVSDWARTYVRAASGLGLMNGTTNGEFSPSENTTRAQAAIVLYRMLAKVNQPS